MSILATPRCSKLANQLLDANYSDTTVVCQMSGIEHASELREKDLGKLANFTIKEVLAKKKSFVYSPSANTVETALRQGLKLAQWGVRMPDPWEQRLSALERELAAMKDEPGDTP